MGSSLDNSDKNNSKAGSLVRSNRTSSQRKVARVNTRRKTIRAVIVNAGLLRESQCTGTASPGRWAGTFFSRGTSGDVYATVVCVVVD